MNEIDAFLIKDEPYYALVGDEIAIFESAFKNHLPVLLKGPTGCGKTRFMEYMAWRHPPQELHSHGPCHSTFNS